MEYFPDGSPVPEMEYAPEVLPLEWRLSEVDNEVRAKREHGVFQYKGWNFYTAREDFSDAAYMAERDPTLVIRWKTADKEEDGVTNVYIDLNAQELIGLNITYKLYRGQVWAEGDLKKTKIKQEYLDNG